MSAVAITRKNRETKTTIAMGRYDVVGLDDEQGPSTHYTICVDHGMVCSHENKTLARSHMSNPRGWCEVCSGQACEAHHRDIDDCPECAANT